MKLHANARTCPHSRRLAVDRVEREGWTLGPRGLSLRRYRYAAMPQPRARTPLVRWPERPPPPATLTATAQMRATTGLNCSNTLAKERCRVPR